jgi:hypothetical protein
MLTPSYQGRVRSFVAALENELPQLPPNIHFPTAALSKRLLAKSILDQCGLRRMHLPFFELLEQHLGDAGIFTNRWLSDPKLKRMDWVRFARAPFPPDAVFFEHERHLRSFIRRSIGALPPLKCLRLIGQEFQLRTGRRIDLLCEEVRPGGMGPLVAIELKKADTNGVVEQVVRYLRDLQHEDIAQGRELRGIVIAGHGDRIAEELARWVPEFKIDWLCYSVELREPNCR